MKNLLVGWAIVGAVIAAPIVGAMVAGDDGFYVVLLAYLGAMMLGLLSVIASIVGEMVIAQTRK